LLEKKAKDEAALEKQGKIPELGHTSLPDFFEGKPHKLYTIREVAWSSLTRCDSSNF
jgi:hypothetical protein